VALDEDAERRTANVIVPDTFLSLAIGREGQNARLAAKLTGWRIDIRSESEAGDLLELIREDEARRRRQPVELEAVPEPPAPEEPDAAEVEVLVAEVDLPEIPEVELPLPEVLVPADDAAVDVTEDEGARKGRKKDWETEGVAPDEEEDEADDEGHPRRPSRQLVRDPSTGKLVAEKRRKRSRRRPDWLEQAVEWTGDEVAMDDFDLFGDPEDFGFEDEDDDEEDEEE
jgi:hypothetical protein